MNFKDYGYLQNQYENYCEICASGMRTIMARIENLKSEARLNAKWNPYHEVRCRIKGFESACNKLDKKGIELSLENLKGLHDIGGIRIVVPFQDDVYAVRDALAQQPSMSIVEERDYIKEPKPSGYRALHLLVVMDIYLSHTMVKVPVEIQIRGILIDSWAVLEHRIRYKSGGEAEELDPEIDKMLTEAADRLVSLDSKLSSLREKEDDAAEMLRDLAVVSLATPKKKTSKDSNSAGK